MIAFLAAALLGLAIGVGCRWLDLPLPAPPTMIGAGIVCAITFGYLFVDFCMTGRT
jgi:XapX domain-containing protein